MKIIAEFKRFAIRGNIIDMAVGFTVGAAFTTVVKSLVNDVVMPPIGFLLGRVDFTNLYILLRAGTEEAPPYASLAEANTAGAVTLNYGLFVTSLISFFMVTWVMFILIRMYNRLEDELEDHVGSDAPVQASPENKKCPHCITTIPYKATRCPQCTSVLDPVKPTT